MMWSKAATIFITIFSFIRLSQEQCVNEDSTTSCSNLAPIRENEPIIVDRYEKKFELLNYKGPLRKGMFERMPRIEQISIRNCDITAMEENLFCHLQKLKFLYISDSSLPNITQKIFGTHCSHLQVLGIKKCSIQDIEKGSFNHMNHLETLLIEYSSMNTLQADLFKGLVALQNLYLKGDNITTIESGAFNDLKNLKILNLNDNKLKEVPVDELKKLTTLEDLYLSSNEITAFDANDLMDHLPRLQLFSFYMNKLPCDELNQLKSDLAKKHIGKQIFQTDCLLTSSR